ncbi:MAG: sulfite exporter TauE/SafE family protein [Hyphomicrobiaceae bacterium]
MAAIGEMGAWVELGGASGWQTLALILAGALAAGFVNGLTGFGTALTGLPIWLQAVEPAVAAQLASACSVLGHISTFPAIWRAVDWRRLAPLIAAGLSGVPIGTLLLPYVAVDAFKLGVGLVLVGHCTFMLVAAGRVRLAVGGSGAEAAVGFIAGVLGGLAALSGVLVTVWASLKAWPKDQRRVVFQAFNFTVLTAMLAASAATGQVGLRSLAALVIAAPGTLLGASLGLRLYRRLDDVGFDRLVLVVLLLSGVALIWTSL